MCREIESACTDSERECLRVCIEIGSVYRDRECV